MFCRTVDADGVTDGIVTSVPNVSKFAAIVVVFILSVVCALYSGMGVVAYYQRIALWLT